MKIIANLCKLPIVAAAMLLLALPGCHKAKQAEPAPAPETEHTPENNADPQTEPAPAEPTPEANADPQSAAAPAEPVPEVNADPQNEPAPSPTVQVEVGDSMAGFPREALGTPNTLPPEAPKKAPNNNREFQAIKAAADNDHGGDLIYGPRALTPNVRLKTPEVVGNMDKRIVQKIVRQRTGEMRACYEKELIKTKDLSGELKLQWIILSDGSVNKVEVIEPNMNYKNISNFEKCLINSAKFWRFPPPKGGNLVQVTFPIKFDLPDD